jgi:hypothetical protein
MSYTMTKTILASGVALALGVSTADAAPVANLGPAQVDDRTNFTMLNGGGGMVGGTNDVDNAWDGGGFNSSSDYTGVGSVSNVTASSTQPFNANTWTAHDIQVFVPGSYSFDTALDGGNNESGILNVTVPPGRLGMHMLFDWNANLNIDVFVVLAPDQVFGSGIGTKQVSSNCTFYNLNCLWTGKGWAGQNNANAPSGNQVWMLASIDGNNDGVPGIPMYPGGPFAGFQANFNMAFDVTNFPPVAGNFSTSAVANASNEIDLLLPGRATDPDGTVDPTSTLIVSGPSNGAPIVVNNNGTVTYTPNAGYIGPDSFQYTVEDNDGSISNVGTASLTVTAVANTPPVANDTTITTDEDIAINIAVDAVASDDDGDPLAFDTFDAISAQGGAVTVDGSSTVLTYTPRANYNGTDTFDFTVTDGTDSSAPATITMVVNAVNDAPVCSDVILDTDVDTSVTIDVENQLLSTCTDEEGDLITLDSTTQPTQGGMLTFDGTNTLTYTPAVAFTGQDTFTYTATDGSDTDTRTTFVNVGKIFSNFTMLDSDGVTFGGTNDVVFSWDGTCYNSVAEADAGPANLTMKSDSDFPFFGFPWFAHDIKVYCPGGPYVIDTCNDGVKPPACGPLSMTVPVDHLGGHILFDWNTTTDIDVAIVWNSSTGGTWQNNAAGGELYQGPAGPTPALDEFFNWISVDADGDGIPGIQFVVGPFINFRANFNLKTTQTGGGGPIDIPKSSVGKPKLSTDGGCLIANKPVKPATRSDWLLVAGFVICLGVGSAWRRRRLLKYAIYT